MQLLRILGATTQLLVRELVRVKLAWDQLLVPHGIQLTLISNPYKSRHEFQHIVFCSMVKAATVTFIKAQKKLHHSSHKTESTLKPPAMPSEDIHSHKGAIKQPPSLSHQVNGTKLQSNEMSTSLLGLYGRTYVDRSE